MDRGFRQTRYVFVVGFMLLGLGLGCKLKQKVAEPTQDNSSQQPNGQLSLFAESLSDPANIYVSLIDHLNSFQIMSLAKMNDIVEENAKNGLEDSDMTPFYATTYEDIANKMNVNDWKALKAYSEDLRIRHQITEAHSYDGLSAAYVAQHQRSDYLEQILRAILTGKLDPEDDDQLAKEIASAPNDFGLKFFEMFVFSILILPEEDRSAEALLKDQVYLSEFQFMDIIKDQTTLEDATAASAAYHNMAQDAYIKLEAYLDYLIDPKSSDSSEFVFASSFDSLVIKGPIAVYANFLLAKKDPGASSPLTLINKVNGIVGINAPQSASLAGGVSNFFQKFIGMLTGGSRKVRTASAKEVAANASKKTSFFRTPKAKSTGKVTLPSLSPRERVDAAKARYDDIKAELAGVRGLRQIQRAIADLNKPFLKDGPAWVDVQKSIAALKNDEKKLIVNINSVKSNQLNSIFKRMIEEKSITGDLNLKLKGEYETLMKKTVYITGSVSSREVTSLVGAKYSAMLSLGGAKAKAFKSATVESFLSTGRWIKSEAHAMGMSAVMGVKSGADGVGKAISDIGTALGTRAANFRNAQRLAEQNAVLGKEVEDLRNLLQREVQESNASINAARKAAFIAQRMEETRFVLVREARTTKARNPQEGSIPVSPTNDKGQLLLEDTKELRLLLEDAKAADLALGVRKDSDLISDASSVTARSPAGSIEEAQAVLKEAKEEITGTTKAIADDHPVTAWDVLGANGF